jgi:two-component system, LytTR family, response regulator AlgR
MTTHLLIVDDEAPARRRLTELVADLANELQIELVGEAENGKAALEIMAKRPVDVLLADIRMPVMDGMELARHLAKLDHAPAIVFTTAYDSYAIEAFEVSAVDYLLKPVRLDRLRQALNKAHALTADQADNLARSSGHARSHLSIVERGKILLVPLADILYLRAELKYVTVCTRAQEYLLEESLIKLEQEFADTFIRIHRNCLVAHAHIAGFAQHEVNGHPGWCVLLKGREEKLPVSRRQQSVVKTFREGKN